jgi:hypothetical protein
MTLILALEAEPGVLTGLADVDADVAVVGDLDAAIRHLATDPPPEATVPTDAPAADGPDGGSADEGLGDALLVADLTPDAEVPGPGQAGAAGRFEAELVGGVLCVDMDVAGLDEPVSGAHVHDGAAGTAGPVLVDLGPPGEAIGGEARWRDACTEVSDEVIERLAASPDQHHVNVHTAAFPAGAVRGQLAVASIFDRTLE